MAKASGDLFTDIIRKHTDAYKAITEPTAKRQAFSGLIQAVLKEYSDTLSEMRPDKLMQLLHDTKERITEIHTEMRNDAFRRESTRQNPRYDDLTILLLLPAMGYNEADQSSTKALTDLIERLVSTPEILLKAFLIEWFAKFMYQLQVVRGEFESNVINELENIVEDSLGTDSNWFLAISILGLHENLVKKKLSSLGFKSIAIEKIEREKKFSGLLDYLVEQINKKEGRDVSLTFYRTSALREIRNKLEHEGYKHSVLKSEVLDLLNDIRKFNDELFPKSSKKKRK